MSNSRSMNKRTFLKSIGLLSLLGIFAPLLKKLIVSDYPVDVRKEPNAIPRTEI